MKTTEYNHTPQPWKVQNGYIGTDEEDTQTIAYLSCHRNRVWRSEIETAANAKLIQHAPDLLEALAALLAKLDNTSVDDWVKYSSSESVKITEIEKAHELIRKIVE